jgi:hypothetical protein
LAVGLQLLLDVDEEASGHFVMMMSRMAICDVAIRLYNPCTRVGFSVG